MALGCVEGFEIRVASHDPRSAKTFDLRLVHRRDVAQLVVEANPPALVPHRVKNLLEDRVGLGGKVLEDR